MNPTENRPYQPHPAPALMSQVGRQDDLTKTSDLFARFNALVIECGRQESLIYSGQGVPPNEALPFLVRVARLAEGLCGVLSMDTYDDVIEALEDAV